MIMEHNIELQGGTGSLLLQDPTTELPHIRSCRLTAIQAFIGKNQPAPNQNPGCMEFSTCQGMIKFLLDVFRCSGHS